MEKHEEYYEEVDNRMRYFLVDVHEELDKIESLVQGNESAVVLLHWVRDAVQRAAENYER